MNEQPLSPISYVLPRKLIFSEDSPRKNILLFNDQSLAWRLTEGEGLTGTCATTSTCRATWGGGGYKGDDAQPMRWVMIPGGEATLLPVVYSSGSPPYHREE